jgi:hypothetical protein
MQILEIIANDNINPPSVLGVNRVSSSDTSNRKSRLCYNDSGVVTPSIKKTIS